MGEPSRDPTPLSGNLHRYVPRVAAEWDNAARGQKHQSIEGTLVFVDISGFTSLTERLSRQGRIGAEELTSVLSHVFGAMLERAYSRGGSLLKFGGDALLVLFEGADHPIQACAAAIEMRAALRESASLRTSVGRIALRMTVGVRSGPIDLFLVGRSSRELVVVGTAATEIVAVEGAANPGQILVSDSTKALIPDGFTGDSVGPAWLLRKRSISVAERGPVGRLDLGDEVLATFVPVGLRAQLGSGLREPEHKIASVAFVAFKGVGAIEAAHGLDGLADALDHFISGVQAAAEAEGITFLSSDADADGGKIILTAGVPGSLVDAEGRILRAASAIVSIETPLIVKIGVHTGHLFVAEAGTRFRAAYTVMGDIVNTGARLMSAAPRGHIYSSPVTLQQSLTQFRVEALPPVVAKGKEHGVAAVDVFEEIGRRETSSVEKLPFVGRHNERAAAGAAISSSGPRVLTITGPTGIGKSRLASEVLGDRRRFTIRGEPAGQANPYWAFRDPLRSLLGIPRADQDVMRQDLGAAISQAAPDLIGWLPLVGDVAHIQVTETPKTSALEAHNRPARTAAVVGMLLERLLGPDLTILAEDLHWLDEATMALLGALTATTPTKDWSIVATTQVEGEARVIGTELPLSPLSKADLRAAAEEATTIVPLRPAVMTKIIERADGNPLFLTELLTYAQTTTDPSLLPESLASVVSSQIDSLPPLDRQLLRHASVLGRSFRSVVIERLIEGEPFSLTEATRQNLAAFLEPDGSDRLRFRTAVVHDAAYEALSFAARRDLHGRAGVIIEELAGDHPDAVAEFLAEHFANAGVADKTWTYSRVAANRALLTYANQTAEVHCRSALEAGRRLGVAPSELGHTWLALGDALQRQAKFTEARAAYAEARGHLDDASDEAEAHMKRAQTWLREGSTTNAKRAITAGRRCLGTPTDARGSAAMARIESFAAAIAMTEEDPHRALAAASTAAVVGEETGDQEALARAYTVLDWAHSIAGVAPVADYGERAVAILESLHHLDRAADVMNNKGGTAYLRGDWPIAIDWYRRSIEASRRAGSDLDVALGEANVVELLVGQRRYHEAREILDRLQRTLVALEAEAYLPFVDLQRGRLLLGLGDHQAAIPVLRSLAQAAVSAGDGFGALEATIPLSLAIAADDPEAALALLADAERAAGDLADHLAPATAYARATIFSAAGNETDARLEATAGIVLAREGSSALDELHLLEVLAALDGDAVPPDRVARRNRLVEKLGVAT